MCVLLRERFGGRDLARAHDRADPGDLPAHLFEPGDVVELTRGVLEPEVEERLLLFGEPDQQRLVVHLAQLGALGGHHPSSRTTKRAFIGSLWIASRIASRATASGTPESSNRMRPGLTTATHDSGLPLPEPMRVSAGFCVIGLS